MIGEAFDRMVNSINYDEYNKIRVASSIKYTQILNSGGSLNYNDIFYKQLVKFFIEKRLKKLNKIK